MSERSAAGLRIGPDGEVRVLRSTGAVALRPTRWGVWMVGAAAHPIGGDELFLRVAVDAAGAAVVRSASATLARRGRGPSVSRIVVRLGPGASLAWDPQPGVAACGADHLSDVRVRLAGGARLRWKDEFVLGRHGEAPGTWTSRLRITYEGKPVLSSSLAAGPAAAGWPSRAVLAGARAVSTLVVVDPCRPTPPPGPARVESGSARAVSLALPGPGVQVTAWGDDLDSCRWAVAQLDPITGR